MKYVDSRWIVHSRLRGARTPDSTVWMPSNGLFDSLDAINGIDRLHMSCRVDRCAGLLVVCLLGIQLR